MVTVFAVNYEKESKVPIIMLTVGGISDRVTGLELGADDYVIKPFSRKNLKREFVLFYDVRRNQLPRKLIPRYFIWVI